MTTGQAFLDGLVDSFTQRYENDPIFRQSISLFTREARTVRDRFGKSASLRCLDLGCGPGIITCEVADVGFDVVGIERSERMIGAACHLSARRGIDPGS